MRWLRSFLPSDALKGEPRAVVLTEAVLSASKFSIPFLTLYLAQIHGFDYATAGLFIAVRGLGGLVAVMVAGAAADRFGERPVVLVLLGGASLSAAAIPHLHGVVPLVAGFFLLGAFVNAVQPAFSSLIVKTMPVRLWTEVYAAEYWALNVGFAITAVVGGRIAIWAFEWLFYLEALGTLVAMILVARCLPRVRPGSRPARLVYTGRGVLGRVRELLTAVSLAARDRLAVALISSTLLFSICLSQMTGTLPLDMESLGYGPDLYGYVIFTNGALLAVFQIAAGRMLARRHRSRVLAMAALVSAVGYALLAVLYGQLVLIMLCLTIWTIGEMMDAPVRNAVVSALARPGSRARYLGLVSAALTLGYCIGPWIGGWLLQSAGRTALWLGTAGCAVACAAIRFALTTRVERRVSIALEIGGPADVPARGD